MWLAYSQKAFADVARWRNLGKLSFAKSYQQTADCLAEKINTDFGSRIGSYAIYRDSKKKPLQLIDGAINPGLIP